MIPARHRRRSGAGDAEPSPTMPCGRLGAIPLLILVGLVGACAERGDFGRPRPTIIGEAVVPPLGIGAAALRGEPASTFHHTDDEGELRRRAWRFLMPSENESVFRQIVADGARTRLLPHGLLPNDPESYHSGLMAESFRSPASRYRRLGEDAAADAGLLGPFADVALRVLEADRVRLGVVDRVPTRPPDQVAEARDRVAENRCLIAWVREAAARRERAYRFALDQLVVEVPQGEAIAAERAITGFGAARQHLEAGLGTIGGGCLGPPSRPGSRPGQGPARLHRAVVAKG